MIKVLIIIAGILFLQPEAEGQKGFVMLSNELWYYDGVGGNTKLSNVVPSAVGQAGKVLGSNGTDAIWQTAAGGGDMVGANNLSEITNATIARSNLGLVVGTNVQAFDADLSTYAGITPSSNIQSMLAAANYAAMRALMDVEVGVDFNAYDADLTTYAGITPSANVQSLLGAADYAAMRTQLGLIIGTNVQAFDADLTTYAGITPSANVQSLLGAANYSAMRTQLSLVPGTDVLAPNGSAANLTGFPTLNQNTNGSAATITTARNINGQSFNGSADITTSELILAYSAGGSPILGESLNFPLFTCNTSTVLVDNTVRFQSVYLPKAATLTGVRVYVRVQGSYTADNNNRIGLYTYSGGTLTLVASSTNSGTLWTSGANAFQTIAFSSTYAASAGLYFVGLLYNQSAQTTAPALAGGTALNNVAMTTMLGTNSIKFLGTLAAQNDLPSSQASSGITGMTASYWVALY